MFNSDQLAEQYKSKAMEIQPPATHEEVIRRLYEADQRRRNHGAQQLRPVLLKIVLILGVLTIISGFTSYIWYHYGDNRVRFQYTKPHHSRYDEVLSSQIYNDLKDVKAKLEVGESAVVYLPEMAKLFNKKDMLTVVSNPTVVTQLKKWETVLAQNVKEYKLPSSGSNDLKFVGGQEELPFGGFVSEESFRFLPELKRESETAEGKVVWKKQVGKKVEDVFTTIYHNERQDEIYVSMQLIKQKTDFKMILGDIERETINVNRAEVYYFKIKPYFLSESNMVQDIQWIETYADYTLVYSVGSKSPTLSKEELLVIVNEMLGS
ncbi:hypothetical protein [Paenibacillus sp. HB172176]|uniref:hypothetical protein n=1 Tax=Paenibacillus sp. HB172176 TaxID=2493690 RepID=UPI00143BC26D|nr:hypothetical protein [Paenibacillus sp. HB172176]